MDSNYLEERLKAEYERQLTGLELIPSENYISSQVMKALGSVYSNKYSEGYPYKRYYGGQTNMDKVESEGIELAKKLFKADHANLQPHSGAPANQAVYFSWLEPGDKVLAMDLSHGGHLTHGHPVTVTAKLFDFVRYRMKDIETGEIDYEEMRRLAHEHQPKIILAGFSSYPRELDYGKFSAIASEVGAMAMADIAHIAGLIAAGVLANPLDSGFHVLTTTTHKTLRGPRGGMILSRGTASNPLKPVDKTLENLPTLIDRMVFPGLQGGPHMNNILAKTVALQEASTEDFKRYAVQVIANAKRLASELSERGFHLVTGGTDNHLILADVKKSHGIDGKMAEEILDKVGLTLNKNVVPDDQLPPYAPSGIRLGTPAMTTRGLKVEDMAQIAEWMQTALAERDSQQVLKQIRLQVEEFCRGFPLPS